MDCLVKAWDAYQIIATNHDAANDFRRVIHEAQRIVMARALARQYKDYWNR